MLELGWKLEILLLGLAFEILIILLNKNSRNSSKTNSPVYNRETSKTYKLRVRIIASWYLPLHSNILIPLPHLAFHTTRRVSLIRTILAKNNAEASSWILLREHHLLGHIWACQLWRGIGRSRWDTRIKKISTSLGHSIKLIY